MSTVYAESDYHQYCNSDNFNEINFKMENNIVYEVPMEMPGNVNYNYTSNYYFYYS
jgi:hypothetical protein